MRSLVSLLCLVSLSVVVLASCGRFAPGFIVTSEGKVIDNNDENNRQLTVERIRIHLDQQLGDHWRTQVTLPELPTYSSDSAFNPHETNSGWLWAKATVRVELVGDGTVPLPFTTEAIHKDVWEYMESKVERPKSNLVVQVTSVTDAARLASLLAPVAPSTTPTPTNTASSKERRYTVLAGDTLADISAVFYGSPQQWKLIRDANPGLDPSALTPGTVLVIPPKP